ncbi:hypothetical protein FA13DRAFT_147166 [Coprinellus micaceus]|uniref:Ctf8-domain-containing protein n=1 Tax=Coprinellus micaceus TaxID=71717 RepID=A0A4Y7TIL4_COPMI|nr:hypothetical protein FA13DRAFT_147166 [Coprinellus micaceus]
MIIPITLSTEANAKLPSGLAQISNDEIILIELQGALDVNVEASPTERNGKFVGKLTVDDAMATLLIGHHLLEGKVAVIPKPLAIMHRTNSAGRASSTSGTGEMDVEETQFEGSMDVDRAAGGEQAPPQWTIQGLVKKKIIFSKRPMPIITRA